MNRCFLRILALSASYLLCVSFTFADDLIRVTATSSSDTISVTGNSLPDFLNDISDVVGQFSVFEGQKFTASVDYAGVVGAIVVTYEPNGDGPGVDRVTVTSLLGSDFSASNPLVFNESNGDLGEQVTDYFLKDAPHVIANFQQALATQTPVGVVSGNPASSAAKLLGYRERRFGIGQITFRNRSSNTPTAEKASYLAEKLILSLDDPPAGAPAEDAESSSSSVGWAGAFSATGRSLSSGSFTGASATFEPSIALTFGDAAAIVLGFPLGYTYWQGSHSGNVGLQLDIPITLIHHKGDVDSESFSPDVRWVLVPGGGTVGAFSYDLAQGGLLWNAGVTNLIEIYDENSSIAITQQYMHMGSIKLEYKDYIVDYGASQDAIQVGVRYAHRIVDNFSLYAGTTWTTFLDGQAYVPHWFGPMAGVAWTFPNFGIISLGFEGEFDGSNWQSYGGQVTMVFPF